MRLKQYITEGSGVTIEDPEEFIRKVKKDCKPALAMLKKEKIIFTRGMPGPANSYSLYGEYSTRKNRVPRDSSVEAHNIADEWFKKKFGWKARSDNVLFAHVRHQAYGNKWFLFNVFPIGKIKTVWSPIQNDLFSIHVMSMNVLDDTHRDFLISELEIAKYTDRAPNKMTVNNEVMIKCKKYYATRDGEILDRIYNE